MLVAVHAWEGAERHGSRPAEEDCGALGPVGGGEAVERRAVAARQLGVLCLQEQTLETK